MPDRRQGDRRDTTEQDKTITVLKVIIVALIIIFIVSMVYVVIHYKNKISDLEKSLNDQNIVLYDNEYDDTILPDPPTNYDETEIPE